MNRGISRTSTVAGTALLVQLAIWSCFVAEAQMPAPARAPRGATRVAYPVVFTRAADLRKLGIALGNYGTDADMTKPYPIGCYYYGDGGYAISISETFLARFTARGFSRRSLCLALVSEARFDPETGRKLPTYIVANPENLARNRGVAEPGDVTEELPLDVPDCFKGGLPYSDCRMSFDLKTGKRLTAQAANELRRAGARIEAVLRDPSRRRDFTYLEESEFTKGRIMVGAAVTVGILNASFYDYSDEFPKAFGYAINADGSAAPDPSAEAVKLALDGKFRATEATLRVLADDMR